MTMYLIPSWVLNLVKRDHIMVIGDSHIKVSRMCSRWSPDMLEGPGVEDQVRQVAIDYLSVVCVPGCKCEVTRKVYESRGQRKWIQGSPEQSRDWEPNGSWTNGKVRVRSGSNVGKSSWVPEVPGKMGRAQTRSVYARQSQTSSSSSRQGGIRQGIVILILKTIVHSICPYI